jgi:hypothetical protein
MWEMRTAHKINIEILRNVTLCGWVSSSLLSSEMSGRTYPTTQRRITAVLDTQQHGCNNFKSRNSYQMWSERLKETDNLRDLGTDG